MQLRRGGRLSKGNPTGDSNPIMTFPLYSNSNPTLSIYMKPNGMQIRKDRSKLELIFLTQDELKSNKRMLPRSSYREYSYSNIFIKKRIQAWNGINCDDFGLDL